MQIPISAKVAFERFSRASGNSNGSQQSLVPHLQEPMTASPRLPTSSDAAGRAKIHSDTPTSFPTQKSNLLRILEGKAPSQSLHVQECCAADDNFSLDNSLGTCSACSESTNSSVSSERSENWHEQKKPKIKSENKISREIAKQEKSAEGLKNFVYGLTIMDYYEAQKKGCNEKCSYGRQCLKKVNIDYIGNLRERFWGSKKDKALNPKQRLKKIQDIFMTASAVKLQEKVSISITCILFLPYIDFKLYCFPFFRL